MRTRITSLAALAALTAFASLSSRARVVSNREGLRIDKAKTHP